MAKIGIKVNTTDNLATSISLIKNCCNNSIGEIKNAILNQDYIMKGVTYNIDDLLLVKKIYQELLTNNIKSTIYVDDEIVEANILDNIIESYYIIDEQTKEDMSNEAEE